MNKKLFQPLRRMQILILLSLGIGISSCFGIGLPLYSKWKEKENQTQIQKKLLRENQKILARKDRIEENYKKIPAEIKSTKPDAQEIAQTQNVITDLAKQTGVKVVKTKNRPLDMDLLSKKIWIELDCEGKILQLTDFIFRMQTSLEAIVIQELRLSMGDEKTSQLRATVLVSKLLILEE